MRENPLSKRCFKAAVISVALQWLFVLCVSAQSAVWKSDSLQEVVVTGTGTRHLLKDVPVQTEVITRQMLQQYGGRSIEDILSGLTASFAFSEGDMGSQMQLNGLGNSYILILVDGKRIQPPSGYPLGFMVRRGDSWCAEYDSSWTTIEAAKERASRLNAVDEKVKKDHIKWDVYVC
jgi:outer membrane receptor for ferrienterochelin and colicin